METTGINGFKERQGTRSLMAKSSQSGLVVSAIWSREDPFFPVHLSSSQYINSPSIYKCGVMLALNGVVFLCDNLYFCNSTTVPGI